MTQKQLRVDEIAKDWFKDPGFKEDYAALEDEFVLAHALIEARAESQLTQEQIARRMGTSRTAIARLEGGKGNPSLKTLRRFAEATGTTLRVRFER